MSDDTPIFDEIEKPTPVYGSIANPEPEKQKLAPQPKVAAAGIAGAITVLVVFAVNLIWPDVVIEPEVSSAFTAIVAFAAGYIKSN